MGSRNILLGLGIFALLSGVLLAILWLRQPATSVGPVVPQVQTQSILVAAQPIPAGTLLRLKDMRWSQVSALGVTSTAIVRGGSGADTATPAGPEAEFVGAVTRRAFAEREPLSAAELVKSGDSEFLGTALQPGLRAVSIGVDATQSTSGLVIPGDRVDIVLTQSFPAQGVDAGHRFVGETVLHDLRIIAVDQTVAPAIRPAVASSAPNEPRMPKTITLEVTEHQAEMLLVAEQLGKIQLTLLGQQDRDAIRSPTPEVVAPAWASDVSPSLAVPADVPPVVGHAPIEVIRGGKIEHRCQTNGGLSTCP